VVPAGSSAHLISCHAARWPPSGRKSTYPTVQFCQATSFGPHFRSKKEHTLRDADRVAGRQNAGATRKPLLEN
jgi:hypothetical protein